MAKKTADTAAAKAKKQKIILVVGAVLLAGLAALQGPKLMSRGGEAAPAPAASSAVGEAVATTPPVAVAATPGATPAPTAFAGKPAAVVAGVALPGTPRARAATSQLASFTLFEAKDPFVPKVDDSLSPAQAAADAYYNANGEAPPAGGAGGGAAANAGGGGSGASGGPGSPVGKPAVPAPILYATINLDGRPQQVKVKGEFPESNPLFVLRSLTKKQAKIGVAGGSFDDGQAVTLSFGKKLTLVNTATGVRYVLKLVYTGAAPEVIEGFTTDQGKPAGTSADASTTTTGATPATAK
jgi:hypothetical protein